MYVSGLTLQLVYEIERARLGRRRLAERAGSTEMAVRLELDRLRDAGLLAFTRSGPQLSSAGGRRFQALFDSVHDVCSLDLTTLRVDAACYGCRLRARHVSAAWEARDVAVRGGASGLVLLVRDAAAWSFAHDGEAASRKNPADASVLEAAFPDSVAGEHLLLAFGSDQHQAARGLWALLAETLDL